MWGELLVALVVSVTPLEKARRQVDQLDFDGASRSLGVVRAQRELSRAQVLELHELEGIVAATLKDAAGAREAFSRLLNLAPDHVLRGRFSPRITQPFYEARTWVRDHGGLEATTQPGALSVVVKNDVFQRVSSVQVHVLSGERWRVERLPPEGGTLSTAGPTKWWVELVDAMGWTLLTVGSMAAPLEAGVTLLPSVAAVSPVQPAPDFLPRPPLVTSGSGLRPSRVAGSVLMGAGVVSAGVGAFFGVRSASTRAALGAAADSQGAVTTMSQADAFALDARFRSDALVANTLFISAGTAFIVGGVLWLLGIETGADLVPSRGPTP